MKYALYIENIDKRINELEFHAYRQDDWDSFVLVMKAEAKGVMQSSPGSSKKPCKVGFLNTQMVVENLSCNDEWMFRLQARVRTLAVSRSCLVRMPWEDHMWAKLM